MTPESVMMMGTEAMKIAIAVAAPLLLVALVTGLIISILQAATQINEMTLSFIPKNYRRVRGDYRCRAVDAEPVAGLYAQPVYQSAVHHRLTRRCCTSPVTSGFNGLASISGRCCVFWR